MKSSSLDKNILYDKFVKSALAAGFTDEQVNWIWDWFGELAD